MAAKPSPPTFRPRNGAVTIVKFSRRKFVRNARKPAEAPAEVATTGPARVYHPKASEVDRATPGRRPETRITTAAAASEPTTAAEMGIHTERIARLDSWRSKATRAKRT